MKTIHFMKFALSMSLVLFLSQLSFGHTYDPVPDLAKWEKLGSRKVNYKVDKDVIKVTAWEGRFNAVKLKVENASINLHRFVIHYRNGQKQKVVVRKNIDAGQSTRVINLKGKGRRIINRVEFWYDTDNAENKRGKIELWGRHF